MTWQYGSPSAPAGSERPRCWGMESAFDLSSRECRGCGSQNSCRDNVVRTQNARRATAVPPPPTAAYFAQFGPTPAPQLAQGAAFHHPVAVQAPVPPVMYQPPAPQVPVHQPQIQVPVQQIRQAQPPAPQQVQAYQAPAQYQYGWLHDPLYYTAMASPPPMRPQLPGETFFERMVKNVGLSMLESFFLQSFLAVRQLVLPPGPVQDPPIDINPTNR